MGWHGSRNGRKGHGSSGHGGYQGDGQADFRQFLVLLGKAKRTTATTTVNAKTKAGKTIAKTDDIATDGATTRNRSSSLPGVGRRTKRQHRRGSVPQHARQVFKQCSVRQGCSVEIRLCRRDRSRSALVTAGLGSLWARRWAGWLAFRQHRCASARRQGRDRHNRYRQGCR